MIEDQVPKMMTTDMLSTHFDVPDLDSVTHITKDESDKEVLIEVKAETELALPLQFSTLVGAALRSKEISAASDTPIPATGPNTAQITRTSYLSALDPLEESCSKSATSALDHTKTLSSTLFYTSMRFPSPSCLRVVERTAHGRKSEIRFYTGEGAAQ